MDPFGKGQVWYSDGGFKVSGYENQPIKAPKIEW
jgi:hypothetical protein